MFKDCLSVVNFFVIGLAGNPLSPEISKIYHDSNGAHKLLRFLLDHLSGKLFISISKINKVRNFYNLPYVALFNYRKKVDELVKYKKL